MMITTAIGALITVVCLALLASPWPILAPLAVFAVFAVAALYKHPAWGLIGLAALVPFEGLFKDTNFTGAKLLGFSLIAVLLIQLIIKKIPEQRLHSQLWKMIYLFSLCVFLSLMFTENMMVSLGNIRELIIGMLFFLITLLVGRELNLTRLSALIAISVAATCVIALLSAKHQVGGRAIGLLKNANYFALLIAIAIPAATLMLLHSRKLITRVFWLAVTILLLTGMTKTDSRSGLLVVLLCFAISAWHHKETLKKIRPKHFGFLMLGASIAIPTILYSLPAEYVERIKSLSVLKSGVNPHQDASLGRRASYLIIGSQMMKDNPLVGSGPGTFPIRYAQSGYAKAFSAELVNPELFRRAHNTYLEIFSEMGVPAGIFFILIIIIGLNNFKVARKNFIHKKQSLNADIAMHLGLCLISIAIFMLFLSSPNHKYLWMFLAISSVIRNNSEQDTISEENNYAKN